MTYPQTNREKAALYLKAVHEIRERLRCIDSLVTSDLAPLLIFEFCQLQLRLASECLAIACLAAQGDFDTHKAFREKYEPGVIFKALAVLYPAFFPTPCIMQRTGEGSWHFDDVGHGNAITRKEIEDIWNRSGRHLHRGSTKRYLQEPQDIDLLSVTRIKERFWNLLLDHIIVLADQTSRFHVHVERESADIQCQFLFLDIERETATVEPYKVEVTEFKE